jgi:hypothetical protein
MHRAVSRPGGRFNRDRLRASETDRIGGVHRTPFLLAPGPPRVGYPEMERPKSRPEAPARQVERVQDGLVDRLKAACPFYLLRPPRQH